MPSQFFNPGVRVRLAGVDVSSGGGQARGLRVAFSVSRTMTASPDSATVEISGLGPDSRGLLRRAWGELGFTELEISAGWGGELVRVFSGDVRDMVIPGVGSRADMPVVASADDAGDALAEALVSGSSLGMTAENMITIALAAIERHALETHPTRPQLVAKHPSVDAAIASSVAQAQLFRTVSIGKASDLLDEAARILGVRWWLREGLLYMAARGAPTDGVAVSLPRTHWLDEPTEDRDGLLRVTTLFSPLLVPGRQVSIVGRASAWSVEAYRCEAVEHTGDTEDDAPWASGLVARRVG
jgi:hypothetical protein